jgi:hypothetical protein
MILLKAATLTTLQIHEAKCFNTPDEGMKDVRWPPKKAG